MGAALFEQPKLAQLALRLEQARRLQQVKKAESRVPDRFMDWRGFVPFAREQLRIKPREDAADLIPLELNWIQRQVVAAEIKARRRGRPPHFIILKYRKGGVSTLEQALAYWSCWKDRHRECLTLAHEPESTRIIFRIVGRFYDYQPERYRHEKTEAFVNHIEFPHWGSLYMAGTAGKSGGTLRGATFARVHLSEAAFYSDLGAVHTSLAESIGDTSAYVLETTPNGREGRGKAFFDMWQRAVRGESAFIPLFFAWHADPNNRVALEAPDEIDGQLDPEARDLMQRFALSKPQMKWWLAKRRRLVADGRHASKILQEHPFDAESCFLYGSDGYYDTELCVAAERRCVEPISREDNGRLRVFELPSKDKPAAYVIGCDPSGGTGNDDAGVVILNAHTGRQAATYRFNRMPPDELGRKVAEFGKRWANPATGTPAYIVVEANNHGHATLTGLLKLAQYPKDRVYHHTDEAKVDAYGNVSPTARAGWLNNVTTHADLTAIVGRMLREGNPALTDVEVVRSIRRVGAEGDHAEFTGRDLAVAAGLAAIGLPYAREHGTKMYVGGQLIDLASL